MKTYELSEFISLLRLGLWSGGEISGLGHVSAASEASEISELSGLTGVWFGSGIMLESIEQDNVGMKLTFSIYDPYEGGYNHFEVSASSVDTIGEVLQAIAEGKEGKEKRGGTQTYIGGSLREKRKYESTHTSIRSGTIPKPRTGR